MHCVVSALTVLRQQRSSVGDGLQSQPDIGAVGPEHQQRLQDGQQLEGHWRAAHLHEPDTKSEADSESCTVKLLHRGVRCLLS